MALIQVRDLVKEYPVKTGLLSQIAGKNPVVHAVSEVSFNVAPGEVVGLVGESGCGKTTLGKMLVHLEKPTSGQVLLRGVAAQNLRGAQLAHFRRTVQMIFQDPYDSLNPRHTVLDIVTEPLRHLRICPSSHEQKEKALKALESVELLPVERFANRFPHQLSGGQRQRVAIARALVVEPDFIVADEPVSMLDVSVRAGILNLLQRLNKQTGVAVLLITHDLATARYLCNRILVMYLGKVVEISTAHALVERPSHPYSKMLLSSMPDLSGDREKTPIDFGSVASAIAPPSGCRFWPRCPEAQELCRSQEPVLQLTQKGGQVACHYADVV